MLRYWKEGVVAFALSLALFVGQTAHAADKTPLASYPGEPNQPLKTGDAVPVAHGGTSAVTMTAHCVLVGAGTSAPHMVCPTSSGYVLTDNGAGSDPSFQAATGGGGSPGGSSGQIQYNNAGAFGGANVSGDCTATILAFVCTKTNGVSFAASATTDTTSASNISSGSLALARIAAISADNLLMNATGSSAAPTGVSVPSCADSAGQHLNFSSHAFSCGTSTGSASLPSIASGHVIGNGTGSTAAAADSTLTSVLDQALGATQGQIAYRNASSWTVLPPGTAGQVLQTNGASANPSWVTPSGGSVGSGGLVLLETHTASSSSSLDFNTRNTSGQSGATFQSDYDEYQIHIVGMIVATNNVDLELYLSSNGGSSYNTTSNYYSGFGGVTNSGTSSSYSFNPTTSWKLGTGISNSSSRTISGNLVLTNVGSTSFDKHMYGHMAFSNQSFVVAGTLNSLLTVSGTAFNAFQIKASSGNLTSGVVRVYGVVH